ncbi:MAG: hypothetical protein COU47_03830 [Candidatus Niyogibacteria bacterium CG10_big_fil_rev_8_21_14_0_10_46_36]|uniref:Adenylate kinase n=1 Tax=Candidatus Niyogibacteria bacterium CG10_big_fil_rev_8_21_14_0_10_46_36 TaxID=1974726 RepID=A0A2H0TE15_9BACT|nr:MAG: hypothetical protein COU47_03830 [Candidatus Niyogibacteria bacterium CG10_big_fil_rev_8_21_14_0_10_46_36]
MQSKHTDAIAVMFMGLPGSGKDTQADLLQKALETSGKVLYIYTGEKLRNAMRLGTYTAREIKEKVMDVGAKAPDFLAVWAWGQSFIADLEEGQHIILSSSPRTRMESQFLDDAFSFYGITRVYPVYLNVASDEAGRRLKERGRADDNDETIAKRLSWFEREVGPAIEYFRTESKNALIELDGNPRDPQQIHKDLKKAIGL